MYLKCAFFCVAFIRIQLSGAILLSARFKDPFLHVLFHVLMQAGYNELAVGVLFHKLKRLSVGGIFQYLMFKVVFLYPI